MDHMGSFRDFMEGSKPPTSNSKRARFMNYWRSLQNNTPLLMQPIPKDHRGTTKGEDTVRVSGSAAFITSIMSRLKDLLLMDNDKRKLQVTFRQSVYTKQDGERTYVLYVNTVEK